MPDVLSRMGSANEQEAMFSGSLCLDIVSRNRSAVAFVDAGGIESAVVYLRGGGSGARCAAETLATLAVNRAAYAGAIAAAGAIPLLVAMCRGSHADTVMSSGLALKALAQHGTLVRCRSPGVLLARVDFVEGGGGCGGGGGGGGGGG